ncbi:MAG: ABC transporter permease [Myxococcota bacterium]
MKTNEQRGWNLGSAIRSGFGGVMELYHLLTRTLYYCVRGTREPGAIAAQMYAIGNRSFLFMNITMGFIGAIITYQSATQSQKLLPDLSMLGASYIKLLVRDIAASVGAMPLATRVGAGIAAEIGSMVVTEQVDALRMTAAEPVDYLVVPRFIASVVMSTAVLICAGAAALGSGMLVSHLMFGVSFRTFLNYDLVTWGDLAVGLIKCVAYGAAIAIVSSHRGLATFGGSQGVGQATTDAVVGSCFAIIVLNFFISTVSYVMLPA